MSPPLRFPSNKCRSLKFKALNYCILNNFLHSKDPGGILLNFLVEGEVDKVMKYFHKGDFGGHNFWNNTTKKILRAIFEWPSLFSDVYKTVMSYRECQIFHS